MLPPGSGGTGYVKDATAPSDFEVKCANCGVFFHLNEVYTHDHGYYCHTCYQEVRREQRIQSKKEVTCAVCGRVLTLHDTKIQDGGKSYCPPCYYKNSPRGARRDRAAEGAGGPKCEVCGRAFTPGDTVMHVYNRSYCPACFGEAPPDAGGIFADGFHVERVRQEARFLCARCHKELGPFDLRVQEGGKSYCERCYDKAAKASGRGINKATRQSAFVPRHSATALREPFKLIECAHCGRVYTGDGLAADEQGRYPCPVCGKYIDARPPAAARPEKKAPEPLAKEDFAVTAQLFKCLSDPCRVKIIESLSEKELNVFAFVEITGYQYSLTSYHLKVLKELGLIKSYKRGNFVVYSLTEKGEAVHEFIEKSRGLT